MMTTRTYFIGLLLVGASFHAGAAAAQTAEGRDVHLRNDCRLASQILETGHPAPHYAWAAETIPKCNETGPEVLARVWARPPVDSTALEYLFYASYTLRDRRVSSAVAAATSAGMPQIVRLTAIRVLTGHAVPSFMLSVADLSRIENTSARVYLGGMSHVSVREGTQPVGRETVEGILRTLDRLRDDGDPYVARVAGYAYDQLCGRLQCDT
jgi:hypothetical protein